MKFVLTIKYIHHQQLSLFYVGLELLRQRGLLNLKFDFSNCNSKIPLLFGTVNGKSFCIDCLDGNNWIEGSFEDNLDYFSSQIKVDYIFKRNLSSVLQKVKNDSILIPFGLSYPMGLKYSLTFNHLTQFLTNSYWTVRYFRLLNGYFDYRTFEADPILPKEMGVLFQVRLWDPRDAKDSINALQREEINQLRIDGVLQLKKKFPKQAYVGVVDSSYARSVCSDLILDQSLSSRKVYFDRIRRSAIGIASTGLHQSIGWKMGEYVAASRAILTEKMHYQVPNGFDEGRNYETFSTSSELVSKIDSLLSNPRRIQEMMFHNQRYYHQELRPDQLVLKILKRITE